MRLGSIVGACCQAEPLPERMGAAEDLHVLGVGLQRGGALETLAALLEVLRPWGEALVRAGAPWIDVTAGGGP